MRRLSFILRRLAALAAAGPDFGLSREVVPIALWRSGESNKFEVTGRLTLTGKPVSGAIIRASRYVLPEPTDANGGFTLRKDQTVLSRTVVLIAHAARR